MNIHLIRTDGFDEAAYVDILELLQQIEGPLHFKGSNFSYVLPSKSIIPDIKKEKPFGQARFFEQKESRKIASCEINFPVTDHIALEEDLFRGCWNFRKENDIAPVDVVVLLSHVGNQWNWFSLREDNTFNVCIHTEWWEYFTGADIRFPISYNIISNLLQMQMFTGRKDFMQRAHAHPRGCMNDFCKNKKDISLKMRTADICNDCQKIMEEKMIPVHVINQSLAVMEYIRNQMLSIARFRRTLQPSRLQIEGINSRLYLTDINNYQLKLTPIEKAIFLLYLNHEEGIAVNEISIYKNELLRIYRKVSPSTDDNAVALQEKSIDALVNPLENSLHEKISTIKRKCIAAMGADMARYYIISKKNNDKYSITLNRKLVWQSPAEATFR